MTKEKEKTETKEKAVPGAVREFEVRRGSKARRERPDAIPERFREHSRRHSRNRATGRRAWIRGRRVPRSQQRRSPVRPGFRAGFENGEAFLARSSVVSFPRSGVSREQHRERRDGRCRDAAHSDRRLVRDERPPSPRLATDGSWRVCLAGQAAVVSVSGRSKRFFSRPPRADFVGPRRGGHVRRVLRVCGTELITAQKGPFPCVSVYRAVSYAGIGNRRNR